MTSAKFWLSFLNGPPREIFTCGFPVDLLDLEHLADPSRTHFGDHHEHDEVLPLRVVRPHQLPRHLEELLSLRAPVKGVGFQPEPGAGDARDCVVGLVRQNVTIEIRMSMYRT